MLICLGCGLDSTRNHICTFDWCLFLYTNVTVLVTIFQVNLGRPGEPGSSRWTWAVQVIVNLGHLVPQFSCPVVQEQNLVDNCHWLSERSDVFQSADQECWSSQEISKQWHQPVTWLHPFFIHHQNPEGTAFMQGLDASTVSLLSYTTILTRCRHHCRLVNSVISLVLLVTVRLADSWLHFHQRQVTWWYLWLTMDLWWVYNEHSRLTQTTTDDKNSTADAVLDEQSVSNQYIQTQVTNRH